MKNFKEWCIENEQFTLLELYENGGNEIESSKIGFSAAKKVNWKCSQCNIEWKQTLNKATKKTKSNQKGCPYCMHKKPSKFFNLITKYPILEKEWNYDKNLKLPTEYLPNSHAKVWWKCEKGHIWEGVIRDRVRAISKNINNCKPICPFCNHEKVSSKYNLVTEFPNIAKQWNYIKNKELTPLEMSPKSNKKVWWICEYNSNHTWVDRVANRTLLNRKCPICSKEFTVSFPARVLYYYLKPYFEDCEIEYRFLSKYTLDIYLPNYKIVIEYDGWYYHSSKESEKRENKKDKLLQDNNITIIRIKEKKEEMKDIVYEDNIISYHLNKGQTNLDELIEKVLSVIEEKASIKINKDVNFKRDYQKIEDLYYHVRKSNSLAVKNPYLAKEWSDNNKISPDTVNSGCNHKVKWICPICNKEYEATVYNRFKHKSACPYCRKKKDNKQKST